MLSVMFSTRNGEKTLPRMLDAFLQLQRPSAWEIIAIDNGSQDQTPSILNQYAAQLPISVLRQPEPGKNRALNLGLPKARGDLIVLTDDDVVSDSDWLLRLAEWAPLALSS